MENFSNKSFFNKEHAPQGLFEKILARIYDERLLRAKRWLVLIVSGLIVGFGVVVAVFQSMEASFVDSGFAELISLMFSDFYIIAADWRNFGIAVLESLPTFDVIAFLGVTLSIMYLLTFFARNMDRIITYRHSIIL